MLIPGDYRKKGNMKRAVTRMRMRKRTRVTRKLSVAQYVPLATFTGMQCLTYVASCRV